MTRSLASLLLMPRLVRKASEIWLPTVKTGFRALIGSWKTMAICLPRKFAHVGFRLVQHVVAVEQDAAFKNLAGRDGNEAHDGARRDRLAGAGFADQSEGLAAVHRQGNAVDGCQPAAFEVKTDAEVFDLQDRVGHAVATRVWWVRGYVGS